VQTNGLVETLETPIKTTRSSSKGYVQRWISLALKPPTISQSNLNFVDNPLHLILLHRPSNPIAPPTPLPCPASNPPGHRPHGKTKRIASAPTAGPRPLLRAASTSPQLRPFAAGPPRCPLFIPSSCRRPFATGAPHRKIRRAATVRRRGGRRHRPKWRPHRSVRVAARPPRASSTPGARRRDPPLEVQSL